MQEYVNQTIRIRGMSQTEALAMVNLANINKRNKQQLLQEIINASSGSKEQTVDHVSVLETISQCLDNLTQTDLKEHNRRNRNHMTVEESLAERKRAENAVNQLHQKLGLKKYFKTFASVEKARPDLLRLKNYIEGLAVEDEPD